MRCVYKPIRTGIGGRFNRLMNEHIIRQLAYEFSEIGERLGISAPSDKYWNLAREFIRCGDISDREEFVRSKFGMKEHKR